MIFFLLLLLVFFSCESPKPPVVIKTHQMTICGRDAGPPIYQAEVPLSWKRIDPHSRQNLSDTTLPICSFVVGNVLITFHNFPYSSLEQRIPPSLQIERWKAQFQVHNGDVSPVAHGGFGGFRLEVQDPFGKAMIGYAMQMTPLLFRVLSNPQIKADYTIKAVGPISEIEAEKYAIDAFANSFELKDPIPSPE
jgi:hypothetical protein